MTRISGRPQRPSLEMLPPSFAALVAAHALLGLAIYAVPRMALAHAALTFAVGLVAASRKTMAPRVLPILCYVAGCEVLWRMARAGVPWEFGKYATVMIALVYLLTNRSPRTTPPMLYFALLLVSVPVSAGLIPGEELRGQLSFNLSGPLAIAACVALSGGLVLGRVAYRDSLLAIALATAATVAAVILRSDTLATTDFAMHSFAVTSGHFGANQVSVGLGLGALAAGLLHLVPDRVRASESLVLIALGLVFGVRSALTFSRQGLYLAAIGMVVGYAVSLRSPRGRLSVLMCVAIVAVITNQLIFPSLEQATGGALGERLASTSLTGRDALVREELSLFAGHPMLGVGPGGAQYLRTSFGEPVAAHTEFTRTLAEHGLFGFASLLVLAVDFRHRLKGAIRARFGGIRLALFCWAIAYSFVSALRVVAPAVALCVALAREEGRGRGTSLAQRSSSAGHSG